MKSQYVASMSLIISFLLIGWVHNQPSASRQVASNKEKWLPMQFIQVKAGTFKMGSPAAEFGRNKSASGDAEKQHIVSITKDFELQQTEVTQGQWYSTMGVNTLYSINTKEFCPDDIIQFDSEALCPNYPVVDISWQDAHEFTKRLSELDAKYNYRLPTETEWEYAARAGSQSTFPFSDPEKIKEYVWFEENSERLVKYTKPRTFFKKSSTTEDMVLAPN